MADPTKNRPPSDSLHSRSLEHEDFASILNLADLDLQKAISFWLEAIPENTSLDKDYIEAKNGQLKKLRSQFSFLIEIEDVIIDVAKVNALFSQAEERLSRAKYFDSKTQNLIDAFFEGASDFADSAFTESEFPTSDDVLLDDENFLDNDTRDLRRMEQLYSHKSSAELYAWARKGYDHLTNKTLTPIRAYAPIRLYSSYSVSHQLASAYRVAKQIGLSWANKLVFGCLHYLNTAPVNNTKELEYQMSLWHMMALTQPSSAIIPTARNYVLRLTKSNLQNTIAMKDALNAVLEAVGSSTPATSASSAFFEFVHRKYGLSDQNMVAFLRCWIAEHNIAHSRGVSKLAINQTWSRFTNLYEKDLRKLSSDPHIESIVSDLNLLLQTKNNEVPFKSTTTHLVTEQTVEMFDQTNKTKEKLLHTKSIQEVKKLVGMLDG